jgi:hypothetical protein
MAFRLAAVIKMPDGLVAVSGKSSSFDWVRLTPHFAQDDKMGRPDRSVGRLRVPKKLFADS